MLVLLLPKGEIACPLYMFICGLSFYELEKSYARQFFVLQKGENLLLLATTDCVISICDSACVNGYVSDQRLLSAILHLFYLRTTTNIVGCVFFCCVVFSSVINQVALHVQTDWHKHGHTCSLLS